MIPTTHPRAQREAGYSLLELVVALAISVALLVAALNLFDFNNRLARVETRLAQMQQSVRAVHLELGRSLRVAGRGGLAQNTPTKALPHLGAVVEVESNVTGTERTIVPGSADSPEAVEGTDVLTVRGVFEGSIYHSHDNTEDQSYLILRDAGGAVTADPSQASGGEIHLCSTSPAGFPQPLEPLREAIRTGSEEALLLAATADGAAYAVVKLDPNVSAPSSGLCNPADPTRGVRLAFVVSGDGGKADAYHELGPSTVGLPENLTSVAFAAFLDEYRYFVREIREVPSDAGSALMPRLSRARLYPNTGEPWGTDATTREASLAMDVADDIIDFQVSLGLDSSQGGGAIADGSGASLPLFESEDGESDDWLFNSPQDDPDAPVWSRPGGTGLTRPWLRADLFYVRVTTVGRGGRPGGGYLDPALGSTEDRTYGVTADDDLDSPWQRRYRRWTLSTTIDLRNL